MTDDGLGGGLGSGFARLGALLAAGAILALGLLQREGNTDARWLLALAASAPFFVLLFWPQLPRDLPTFNRTVVRLGTLLAVGFLLVSIHLVRLQIVRADALAQETRLTEDGDVVANQRLLIDQLRQQRGKIYDRNGQLLADTVITNGYAIRRYPARAAAPILGYYNPQVYGKAGLEAEYDAYLRGSAGSPFTAVQRDLLHKPIVGNDLVLTLDLRLQQLANDALGGRPGAVIALDPRTGAILAAASAPNFDPQQLVIDPNGNDAAELARVKEYWGGLNLPEANDPLVNRALQGLYVPGSIFKTVTVSAALNDGIVSLNRIYPDPGDIVIDGHRIVELNRPQPVKNEYSVREGYLFSLNVVFAQVGLDLGTPRMNDYARRFGFGEEIPFVTAPGLNNPVVAVSSISGDPNYLSSKPALADTSFGQGELLVSPLHMALITASIANGGKMPQPYLVGEVRDPSGRVIQTNRPRTWKTPLNAATADQVKKLMIDTVDQGGANRAKIDGLVIGGKTGTAEVGDGTTHAWFICFAGRPNQQPELVIVVIAERGGSGGATAIPIARQLLTAYFR